MSTNRFRTASDQQISDAIETGLTAIFKELQDEMGVTCGGVAGEYDMGNEAEYIRECLKDYFSGYVDRENLYGPLENDRFTEAHHAYMLTMGFGLDGSADYGMFCPDDNDPDVMVGKLSITVPNRHTHVMTVEFSPGTSDVVHIDLQPLAAIEIPWDAEDEEVEAEGHGAFCD